MVSDSSLFLYSLCFSSSLARALQPSVLMQMKLSDGSFHRFEVKKGVTSLPCLFKTKSFRYSYWRILEKNVKYANEMKFSKGVNMC